MFKFVCLFALVATSAASSSTSESDSLLTSALKMVKECGDRSMVLCMKERALHYFDTENGDVKLTEGISLIKTDDIPVGRSLSDAALPDEPEARENEVDALLVERVARFFGTHTLQFKVPKDSIQDMQRALEESRGKKKEKKKYLLPLLMLFKLKMAALLPLAIGFLALISFKALVIGKIALLLSGIIGLKKLLESKKENYEVVAHPHYSHEEHGYGRSLHEAQKLAYSAYKQ
uniref:Osiris 9 n=1 Tax=Ceratitis capitata TaxID=7213 RepID=W8BG86_CERCA